MIVAINNATSNTAVGPTKISNSIFMTIPFTLLRHKTAIMSYEVMTLVLGVSIPPSLTSFPVTISLASAKSC